MYSYIELIRQNRMSQDDFFRQAAAEGIKYVEILDQFWKGWSVEEAIDKTLAMSAETGIKTGCFTINNDFVMEDYAGRKKEIMKTIAAVDTAKKLGAPVIRVMSGLLKNIYSFEEAKPWIVEGFREAVRAAEDNGVILVLENSGKQVGRAGEIGAIIEAVGSDHLQACLDTANFYGFDEDPVEATKLLGPKIVHVHVKDVVLDREGWEGYRSKKGRLISGITLGEGLVDFKNIFCELRKNHYTGLLSIEYEGRNGDPINNVSRSIAFIAKLNEN